MNAVDESVNEVDAMYAWLLDCSHYPQGLSAERIVGWVDLLYVGGGNQFIKDGSND